MSPRPLFVLLACVLACTDGKLRETVRVIAPASSELEFGDTYLGASGKKPLSLTNLGTGWIEVHALAFAGEAGFGGPQAPLRLAPGQKLDLELAFTPNEVRAYEGTLTIASDAENAADLTIALHGRGVAVPSCDDGNGCTTDAFDASAGSCTHTPREGSCDDGNACTTAGICDAGVCRGVAVACDDHDPCTRDVCDATTGCLALPDASACQDDNPCTVDLCDPAGGCRHAPAPDGTGCGALEGCRALHVCVGGTCRALQVPDGTPCSDGDICTTGDQCAGGVCTGTRATAAAALVGWVPSFGADDAVSAWLDDTRMVVVDTGSYLGSGPPASHQFSIVRLSGEKLELVSSSEVPGLPLISAMVAPTPDRIVTIHSGELRVFDLVAGGVVARGRAPLAGVFRAAVTGGGAVYLAYDGRIAVLDLTNPDAPVVDTLLASTDVGFLAYDEAHRQLLGTSLTAGILRFDATQPTAPTPLPTLPCNTCGAITAGPAGVAIFEGVSSGAGRVRVYPVLGQPAAGEIALAANEGVSSLGFTPAGLVATRITQEDARTLTDLMLYDLSTPAQPRLAGTFALFGTGGYPGTFAARGNHVLLLPRMLVFEVAAASGQSFRPLSGPAHGSIELVAANGSDVVAYSSRGVHLMRGGVFAEGATTVGSQGFVRFGAPGQSPVHPASTMSEDPSIAVLGGGSSFVLDATSMNAPTVDGSWSLGGLRQFGVGRGDGRYLYGVSAAVGVPTQSVFTVHDLGSGPERFDAEIPALSSILLADADVQIGNAAIGVGGDRVVVALSLANGRTRISVFDVTQPGSPTAVASSDIDGHVGAVAVAGDVVVAVAARSNLSWGFGGERLMVLAHPAGAYTLVERSRVDLAQAGNVLAFDGHTAVVGQPHAVTYVDVDRVPPLPIGSVALPSDPRAAMVSNDQLVIAAGRGMAVLDPPCPPAP